MESLNVEAKVTLIALLVAGGGVCSAPPEAFATETENLGLAILPTPGAVKVDGRYDDWDLSSAIFVSRDELKMEPCLWGTGLFAD
jgi:hypothetical protein